MFRTFGFGLILTGAVVATASAHPLSRSMAPGMSQPDSDGSWVVRISPPNKFPAPNWEHVSASSRGSTRPAGPAFPGATNSRWSKN